jgi:hypothetical protein
MRITTAVLTLAVLALPVRAQDKTPSAPGGAGAAIGGGERLTHAQWSAMPTPDGVSFATGVVGYSSQYSASGWSAGDAVGFPDVYPRHGDLTGAWAPATTTSARDVLTLAFNGAPTMEIWIFETYGVGGVHEVYDATGGAAVLLWIAAPAPVAAEARVLRITLPAPRPIGALQIVVNPAAVDAYPEIDAVAIVPTLAGRQLAPGAH